MIDLASYEKLFVVDTFSCPEGCHVVVTMRCPDKRHWIFALVRSPLDINFGDTVYAKSDRLGHFMDGTFYLYRGPHLTYRMICDELPDELVQHLLNESPGITMASDDDGPPETY